MVWLELRTNETNYNEGWNSTESVWAPMRKSNNYRWGYWEAVNSIAEGDIIIHIKSINNNNYFIGYSIASGNAYITHNLPTPNRFDWDFSRSFYKADLQDFIAFAEPIDVANFFEEHKKILTDYYYANKFKKKKELLFYVIQRNQLQCQFGAYFSQFSDKLQQILFGTEFKVREGIQVVNNVATGTRMINTAARLGHSDFSKNVKDNYNNKCCYPLCDIHGADFLLSGHITRWSDNETLRGYTGNGLCLCPNHDKAFEKGYFTLDMNLRIVFPDEQFNNLDWLKKLLIIGKGKEIKVRQINPLPEAIRFHWKRIGYNE